MVGNIQRIKTGIMIQEYFEKCDVEFIEEKKISITEKKVSTTHLPNIY